MRRWIAAAAALVVLLVAVGALAFMTIRGGPAIDGPRGSKPSHSPAGDARVAPDPALQRFYDQELQWSDCDDDNQCARLEVPLDWAEPGGRTIEVAILRRNADVEDARIGSVIVNPGGPGASGQQYADDAAHYFSPDLTARFDFVGFDPRGVGESAPVDCLADAELDAFIAADPVPDGDDLGEFVDEVRAFGEGCERLSGEVLGHVSTIDSARDMDVLRAALEEDAIMYFGASYGTKLGATYAQLFPERVGRLVLDGAVDLRVSPVELSLAQARGFQTAFDAYADECLRTAPCFLGESRQEAAGTVGDLMDRLAEEPLQVGSRELGPGLAFYGLVTPLYNREYWFMLTNALKDALEGDGAQLMLLADAYSTRQPSGGYSTNIVEANYAINCLDDPRPATPRRIERLLPRFQEASPVFGEVFAWGTLGCTGFEARSDQRVDDPSADGADPILVLGTTRDPATPYEWAESLADQLASGVLVSRDGDGHTAYNSGNSCIDDAVEAYLISGEVPEDGLLCGAG